jgi:hypothetical protein
MLCLKCEHPLHDEECTAIEGKIEGIDRPCTCTMTAGDNKTKRRISNSSRAEERRRRGRRQREII